jgi:UDP-N-acetylmuramyl tripeptide synthase
VRTAVIGTLGHGLRGALQPLANTTPDAVWLHARLADFARRGDIVLIAGKGHETYQEVKGIRRPFSDAVVAREILRRWHA